MSGRASPWAPGSPRVTVGGVPAVTSTCRLTCMWGGQISVVFAGLIVRFAPMISHALGLE